VGAARLYATRKKRTLEGKACAGCNRDCE